MVVGCTALFGFFYASRRTNEPSRTLKTLISVKMCSSGESGDPNSRCGGLSESPARQISANMLLRTLRRGAFALRRASGLSGRPQNYKCVLPETPAGHKNATAPSRRVRRAEIALRRLSRESGKAYFDAALPSEHRILRHSAVSFAERQRSATTTAGMTRAAFGRAIVDFIPAFFR